MSIWQVNKDHISLEIKILEKHLELFKDYLFHRFREFYSQADNYILPNDWTFNNNIISLRFDQTQIQKDKDILNDNKAEFITALKTIANNHQLNIAGFSQFLPIKGKWLAPPSFFTKFLPLEMLEKLKRQDIKFMDKWLSHILNNLENESDKEILGYFNLIKDSLIKSDYSEIIKLVNKFKKQESPSFLDVLTEAEFFNNIRQIYKYRRMNIEDSPFKNIQKNEDVLEIDLYYNDYHFGKINRPSVQELWDQLMDNSHVTRLLVYSDLKNPPNPTKRLGNDEKIVEWIDLHRDQQIIVVKNRGKSLPKRGFLYVYEFGDIDQIQKKRRFINYVRNHPFFEKYINQSPIKTSVTFTNKYKRKELAQIICDNRGLFAVQGPPGTGKTYLAAEVVARFLKLNPYAKVLICSKEHLALNYILKKVVERLNEEKTEFRAFRSMSYTKQITSRIESYVQDYLSSNIMKEIGAYKWDNDSEIWYHAQENLIQEYDLRNLSLGINSASIIFCTTMDGIFYRLISKKSFDLVVIEEAGKSYPSELLHATCIGQNVLLIGDQNQLPPYQIKETEEGLKIWEKILKKIKSNNRLDEDLQKRFGFDYLKLKEFYSTHTSFDLQQLIWLKPFETLFNILPDEKKHVLNHQYRMERPLSNLIGKVFYNREFKHKKKLEEPLNDVIPEEYNVAMLWIDTPHLTDYMDATEDPEKIGLRVNFYELSILIAYLKLLIPSKDIDLIILTPYNDQKDLFLESEELRNICSKLTKTPFKEIIRTTDEYQGHEADLTILSLVRNNTLSATSSWGFIVEPERLNVMFSRTRSRQVIIGCTDHIIRNKHEDKIVIFNNLYLEYKKEGKFIKSQDFLKSIQKKESETNG
ncbi:MAG: AAA domain-containing protein [Promethearchaeota archaeon]